MSTPVEKIKERLGIEEVVGSYIKLEKVGKNLKARCPFHNEKTPSFYISPERESFYCFGCGAKGDIFNFVEQFEGLDFMGALKVLADKAGVSLTFEKIETKNEKERMYMIMEEATKFYEKGLENNKEAEDYLYKRGLKSTTIKDFRIGYIVNDWRLLYFYLKDKKYTDTDIEKVGLIKKPEDKSKGYYDRFRNRIMFPIMDSSGRVIAFSGRILHDDGKSAKYLNSPDTLLYNKSTVLYGIDKAKLDIRKKNYSILVEGQMDLVLSHQAGIRNTLAVSGTALADTLISKENIVNNLGIVKRLSTNIILAFDSDNAGRRASSRSAEIALSLGMDVKIADLPEGNDPADLVLKDKEGWKNVLRNAKPVVEFQIDKVMKEVKDKKLDNRKIPALIREDVLPFILAVQGAMERSGFVKMIKERTGISEEAINKDLGNFDKKKAYDTIPSNVRERLLDPILRKFGLLINIEREHSAIKRITGNERYNNLIKEVEPFKDALQLEAEVLFTNNSKGHVEELLLRLEEDIIREELSRIMEISDKKTLEEKYKNLNNRKKEIEDKLNNIKK
ncbi:MAG TPA: DNA primase [Candidatus Paceibacterota bacterium]